MEYREIVAVTGMGGLFQLLATKSDGAIVRNLADKTTKFISARLHNVTPLESIEIYTTGANVRLHEVLEAIKNKESEHPILDTKTADNTAIKAYLKTVFPDIDEDRVYVSDMKKMLRWYELLKANDLLHFEAIKAQQDTDEKEQPEVKAQQEEAPTPAVEKPAKKASTKKKAASKEPTEEEAPAKKTAAKKSTKKKTEE